MRAKTKVKNAEQEGLDGQIRVCDVEKYYGTKNNITKAVNRVSFTVEKGEFVGIMGASGSGKTTLLNLMSTIDSIMVS